MFYLCLSMHVRVGWFSLHFTQFCAAQSHFKRRRSMLFIVHSLLVFLLFPYHLTSTTSKFLHAFTKSLYHFYIPDALNIFKFHYRYSVLQSRATHLPDQHSIISLQHLHIICLYSNVSAP